MIDTAARVPYPGSADVIDGSQAVVFIETRLAEACCAYAALVGVFLRVSTELIDVTAAISGDRRGPAAKRARSEVAA